MKDMNTDEIVEKLKSIGWDKIYDKHNISVDRIYSNSDFKERVFHEYYFKWTLKHTNKDDYILDVGCSDGELCWLMKEKGCNPTGIDVSSEVIKLANDNVEGVPFKKMYVEQLEFQNDTFNVVTCTQVLEHLPEPKAVIKEMLRVLKKNGKLIVTVPIRTCLDLNGRSKHIQHWGLYEVMHLFEEFGNNFKIYYLNKCSKKKELDNPDCELNKKNLFGIIFIKE